MFDLRTKVMIGIASTLLIAAIMLITLVFCLYQKISKALKGVLGVRGDNTGALCWNRVTSYCIGHLSGEFKSHCQV